MELQKNIEAFSRLGERLRAVSQGGTDTETERVIVTASSANPWFTKDNIYGALGALGQALTEKDLEKWMAVYKVRTGSVRQKRIGVISAGNIPAVGFHDFLCVLMSGNIYEGKNSSDDALLLPHIASMLKKIEHSFEERIFLLKKFLFRMR